MKKYVSENFVTALRWDGKEQTLTAMAVGVGGAWHCEIFRTRDDCLLIHRVGQRYDSYDARPAALCCPLDWYIAVDGQNVSLLRPENFGPGNAYRKVVEE